MVRIDDVVAGKLLTSRPSDQPRQSDQHRSEEFVPRILAVSKHPKQPNVTAKQPLKASPPAQTPTAQSALALASESTSQSDANIPAAVPAILIPGPWTRRPSLVASAQQLEPGSHAPSAPRPEVCAVHPNPATSSTSASPDSLTADQSSWSPLRRLSLATSPVSIGTGTDGVALVAMAALSEAEEQAESEKEKKLATMAAFFAEKPPPRRLSVDGGPSHAQAAPPQSGLSRQAVPIADEPLSGVLLSVCVCVTACLSSRLSRRLTVCEWLRVVVAESKGISGTAVTNSLEGLHYPSIKLPQQPAWDAYSHVFIRGHPIQAMDRIHRAVQVSFKS
eukprot:683142-Rhodomonas_salina.10